MLVQALVLELDEVCVHEAEHDQRRHRQRPTGPERDDGVRGADDRERERELEREPRRPAHEELLRQVPPIVHAAHRRELHVLSTVERTCFF